MGAELTACQARVVEVDRTVYVGRVVDQTAVAWELLVQEEVEEEGKFASHVIQEVGVDGQVLLAHNGDLEVKVN